MCIFFEKFFKLDIICVILDNYIGDKMNKNEVLSIMKQVQNGNLSTEKAVDKLTYTDLGFAKADNSRKIRQGANEVIYGEGKTAEQITEIVKALINNNCIIITRLNKEKADIISKELKIDYDETARLGIIGNIPKPSGKGKILVCCAGTSDLYCAKEAYLTAKALGNEVELLCDVGVAGIHRLLDNTKTINEAKVIIAIAGMEGALASVIGGIAECPVIAVPTSVGYGASFGGISALLGMLNSCASNVSVVNIDNGFSAGNIASIINHQE